MSYDEHSGPEHGFTRFRSTMHISMGVLYLVFGSVVIYLQKFGGLALPGIMAYIVGGLMLLYGVFRIWRGLRDAKERKMYRMNRERNNTSSRS